MQQKTFLLWYFSFTMAARPLWSLLIFNKTVPEILELLLYINFEWHFRLFRIKWILDTQVRHPILISSSKPFHSQTAYNTHFINNNI